MNKHSKIFIAGASGMVGSALVRRLRIGGYTHLLTPTRAELKLNDQAAVAAFFACERPEYVFLRRRRLGGFTPTTLIRRSSSTTTW